MTITKGVPDLHPLSSKFYRLEWTEETLGDGVTIDTVTWTTPAEIDLDEQMQSGLIVGARLSSNGATIGNTYEVTCKITTSANETRHRVFQFEVGYDGE